MSAKTNYLENALLNHVLRNTPYTPPEVIYVALYTTATDEAGGGTEVTAVATGYVRQVATFGIPDGVTVSTADILFPVATASYGTVTDFALLDDVTGGNMLYYGELPVHKTIAIDDQVKFTAGSLQVSEA